MGPRGLRNHARRGALLLGALILGIHSGRAAHAEAPSVTLSPAGVKIRIAACTLAEALDALARTGGFKVTYEGARPSAMLFNTEIDAPTPSKALFRLIEGQNLNYGVVLDVSGVKVSTFLVLGVATKPGAPVAVATASRPQTFPTPRSTRNQPAVNDEEPESDEAQEAPEPTPSPTPPPPVTRPGFPSPFAPRPFGAPFGPRPLPSPSASPSP